MVPTLQIDNLCVSLKNKTGSRPIVSGFSGAVNPGETWGVVGESGAGKSIMTRALLGLLDQRVFDMTGKLEFQGGPISEDRLRTLRGSRIGAVFQNPVTSLNPVLTVQQQLFETVKRHGALSRSDILDKISSLLMEVDLTHPRYLRAYPHQLSGGENQRVMLAISLAGDPDLLVADEPSTALDSITRAQVVSLLSTLVSERKMSMIIVSHDIDVVRSVANTVTVMRDGVIVESGPASTVLERPGHPYTRALLSCKPTAGEPPPRLPTMNAPRIVANPNIDSSEIRTDNDILQVTDLSVKYSGSGLFGPRTVHAVKSVSLSVTAGKTLAIVGGSGCGKTSLALAILQLIPIEGGRVRICDIDWHPMTTREVRPLRKHAQIVFQNPQSSLNPRLTIFQSISEPMLTHGIAHSLSDATARATSLLAEVGLSHQLLSRYPWQLSGGEQQRICIARALSLEPNLLVCDECVSALDNSIQTAILNMLKTIQKRRNLAILFISHNMTTVRFMADSILVMDEGAIVESGQIDQVLMAPKHPTTTRLIEAASSLRALN